MLDQPAKPIPLPEDLPGTSYSLNQQCELAFGVGSKPCPYMQYCAKLWCTGKARGQIVCQTRHFPWADGTACGDGRFCLKGACVERHNVSKYRVSAGSQKHSIGSLWVRVSVGSSKHSTESLWVQGECWEPKNTAQSHSGYREPKTLHRVTLGTG